jgi:hypothetical protein
VGTRQTVRKSYKRAGILTKPEKDLIAAVVLDQPRALEDKQINSLAKGLRRSREAVKNAVLEAKDALLAHAGRYVEVHAQVVEDALSNGDAKSLEVAARASQWAIEHMNADGATIVDKGPGDSGGVKIMIGVKVGGANDVKVE